MTVVTVRYWAAARAAAGASEERVEANVKSLADLLEIVRFTRRDVPRFGQVLGVCSYIVDGDPVGKRAHDTVVLRDGSEVEVLPPFAGG